MNANIHEQADIVITIDVENKVPHKKDFPYIDQEQMKGEKTENMIVDHQKKRRTTLFRRNPTRV